jgi:peptidoglycan/xylan/chitin deacetylase (PgdA/CDA1 family)
MTGIKSALYRVIAGTRLHTVYKALSAHKITFLMYHGIADTGSIPCWWQLEKSKFEMQMEYVKNNFQVISIDQAFELILSGKDIPRDYVVITFDDGYRNFLTNTLPILKKNNMPAVLYVPVGPVTNKKLIWSDELYLTLYTYYSDAITLINNIAGCGESDFKGKKELAIERTINCLKELPVDIRRDKLERFYNTLSRPLSNDVIEGSPFKLLSIKEIKVLSKESIITIGSHADSHEPLTSLAANDMIDEVRKSGEYLEQLTGRKIEHFCYPAGFYNDRVEEAVKNAGYKSAVLDRESRGNANDIFKIPRAGIGAFDSDAFFECQVYGVTMLKNTLKKRLFQ